MKKVLVISTSPRKGSNSATLALKFSEGAKSVGHEVDFVSLYGKEIAFCKGCFACQKLGKCVIDDYANEITEKMLVSDVIVFATPVYYYTMNGQMKTIIDRANSLFKKDYKFREVFVLCSADDPSENTIDGVVGGVECWLKCYPKASVKGSLLCGGIEDENAVLSHPDALAKAFEMGKNI